CLVHLPEQPRRLAIQKFTCRSHANVPSGPFEQLNSETVLHALHLTGDRALGQSGDFGSLGKASVLHNQVKERQFIQIEGHCAEKAMHDAHQCMRLMNFTQELLRHRFAQKRKEKLWRKEMKEYRRMLPVLTTWT